MGKKTSPKDGKKGEIKEQNLDETSRKQRPKWQIWMQREEPVGVSEKHQKDTHLSRPTVHAPPPCALPRGWPTRAMSVPSSPSDFLLGSANADPQRDISLRGALGLLCPVIKSHCFFPARSEFSYGSQKPLPLFIPSGLGVLIILLFLALD